MEKAIFTITENAPLTESVFRLRLAGDTSAITSPGQFVNILLDGFYLRRPFSVCDWDEGEQRGAHRAPYVLPHARSTSSISTASGRRKRAMRLAAVV